MLGCIAPSLDVIRTCEALKHHALSNEYSAVLVVAAQKSVNFARIALPVWSSHVQERTAHR